jgi:Fibronectin type III domain
VLGRSLGLRLAAVTAAVVAVLGGGVLAGAAPASAALAGVPGAPGGVKVVAQNQGAVVSWTAPASTGGSAITGYVIKASPGGKSVKTSVVTSFLVGGLNNGTAYQFSVAAVNKYGTGPASSLSAAVTPKAPSVPGVPGSVAAVAGFQQVSVSWVAPASNGGTPVTSYRISTSPATSVVTVTGSARSAVLSGLADGTAYKVLVAAVNSVGAGKAASAAAVTPHVTVPGSPVGVTAAPTSSGVSVGWQPPLSDGGSAVTGYVVTVTGTSTTVTAAATARSVTITGLTAGISYTFRVAAVNVKGRGPSVTSTPATAGATAGSKTVVLSAASLATLTLVGTDGSLVFTSPTTQVSSIAAGDIVVAGVSSATPAGLMAQVTSVTSSGSTLTLATTPASLDQALSAAGFGITSQLTQSQVTSFTAARAGVKLLPAASAPASASPGSITLSLNANLYKDSQGRAVSVAGSITLTPQMSFSASITCCTHTASHFTGTVTAAASLSLKAALSHDISGDITLGTLHFAPITITVAGVPVVILPTLTVKLTASGTITAGLSSRAGASVTTGAKVATADSAVTVTPVFTHTTYFAPLTVYGKVEAAAGPEADLSATVDGLPGPDLTDTLSLPKLTADPAATPWWTLSAENVVALDYQLKLLDHLLASYHKTISDVTLPLAHAGSPYQQITITPSPAVTTPGGTFQLHAQVGGAASQAVTWNAPTGNGIITTAGLYTAPTTPGTYQITAAQPASGLKPSAYGLTSIQVGDQPPSPPTNPTATSTSYGTATITWQPPTDSGGGTITSYKVTAMPGGQTQTAAGTATMTGLIPGATYTFTITAASDGGISVPSPATNPVVIDNIGGGGSGTWTPTEAPLPANAAVPYPGPTLFAVACASTSACTVVGDYTDTSGNYQGLLVTGSGSTWTATEMPLPANAGSNPDPFVPAVACPSTSVCAATGRYTDSSGNHQGLLVTGSGSTWTAAKAPLPANAGSNPDPLLSAVACPSAAACTAVGDYTDTSGDHRGLLETWSGNTWTATEAPLPANAAGGGSLAGVACPSTSVCTAVGDYGDAAGHAHLLTVTGSGSTWTAAEAPLPANAGGPYQATPQGISCSSASACTAVGGYSDTSGGYQGFLATRSGSIWTASEAPLPAGASSDPAVNLQVACPSTCVAVGNYGDTSNNLQGLLVTQLGGTWTGAKAPFPANAAGDPFVQLGGVACASAGVCAAAGSYATSGPQRGLLEDQSGSTWTAVEAPLPANANSNGVAWLSGIACPSSSMCVAVGNYGDTYPSLQGLLVTGPGK